MNKRIGVLIGKVYKDINFQHLKGILKQAYSLGFQVYVFTLTEQTHNEKIIEGEENLLNMINFSLLDGIIYVPYTFSSPTYWAYIEAFLVQNCTVPVVRIGTEKEHFTQIWHDEIAEAYEITKHLIDVHGCKRIHCLTGLDYMDVSHNRLAGYKQAMDEAGLSYTDEDITFGDFWVYKSQELAKEIADGKREKPDAVVCANDVMAIALCDALKEHGYAVPDDVRIIGYDGTTEACIHVPPVSSYQTSWTQLGIDAMCALYEQITGEKCEPVARERGTFWKRESCGCSEAIKQETVQPFNYQQIEENYIDANLSSQLHSATNLRDFMQTVYQFTEVFLSPEDYADKQFYLCLCEDWNSFTVERYESKYRTSGYSDRMLLMAQNGRKSLFPLDKMLPDELVDSEPTLTFFNAVHFEERCFGYAVLKCGATMSGFNIHYLRFIRELNNGLELLCVRNELKSISYRQYVSGLRDTLTGLYKIEESVDIAENVITETEQLGEFVYIIGVTADSANIQETGGSISYDRFLVQLSELVQECRRQGEKVFITGNGVFVLMGHESALTPHHFTYEERVKAHYAVLCEHEPNYPDLRVDEIVFAPGQITLKEAEAWLVRKLFMTKKPAHYDAIIGLKIKIYSEPGYDWSLDKCSSAIGVSKPYFQKLYQQITGASWLTDIRISRFQYAKTLLIHTDHTLETIAEMCGYEFSYFMRTFKKETGMTPKQYRKSHKK